MFISYQSRALRKTNNTMSMLYVGKRSLRIWVTSQRSPNMRRETDLNPSLTPKLFVPWHVVLSFDMLLTSCLSCHSTNEKMVNSLRASILYPSLRPYCQKKCCAYNMCSEKVWWMNFEVLTVNQIWRIFIVLSMKNGKWWLTLISPSSKHTYCLTSHQENAKLTS